MDGTAIATEGLTHCFGKLTAVDDLHLEVPAGTVCGFLGRNGAGKTTTIQILMNLLRPTAGTAEVLGLNPASDSLALRRQVGYVAENRVMYGWMKVREIVWFTGQFYETWNQGRVDALISRFDLDPEQKVKHLSRGMNAQLALALALGHEPRLLILDEPASGLDVVVRRDFLESIIGLIQEEGRTVFLSSHLVHEVERVADRVAIIDNGRLVADGDVDEVKGSVKRVVARMPDGADELSDIKGLRQVQGEGPRRLLTVVGYGEAQAAKIQAQGGQIEDVLDVGLEEAFVAHVRPDTGGQP
ncbi:MAG: ABC transporter ATP-binding protein [Gemmatimonadota bacterium]|nr:ABC transporter ATP-binding protein [Gemmatimonadota bacterium]